MCDKDDQPISEGDAVGSDCHDNHPPPTYTESTYNVGADLTAPTLLATAADGRVAASGYVSAKGRSGRSDKVDTDAQSNLRQRGTENGILGVPQTRKSGPPTSDAQLLTVSSLVSKGYSSVDRSGHVVVVEEVAPSASSIIVSEEDKDGEWKLSINPFTTARTGNQPGEGGKLSKRVRRYYKSQNELIETFEDLHLDVSDAMDNTREVEKLHRKSKFLAQLSFVVNALLLVAKTTAAVLTGSLAVISAVIDSAVDLVSGALMWWSNRAIKKTNLYTYPEGRTKLEPVAIVIISVIMSVASIQVIIISVTRIVEYTSGKGEGPEFSLTAIVICCATVVIKLILFLLCRRVKTPSASALAQDHRNDVISNTGALAFGLIEQIKLLTGHTARPDFLKKITWMTLNHHPAVMLIETVRAYHFGNNFLVEVHIVLPAAIALSEAHDIGETLQGKIERLPEVERAFVHLDYEAEHHPKMEHKQV